MMVALIVVLCVITVVLGVLVGGLLRAYATLLDRLHQLDGGAGAAASSPPPFRTAATISEPPGARIEGRTEWAESHDINGVTLQAEIVSVRTVAVGHDTVIAFLSSGCEGCAGFWRELGEPGSWTTPEAARLVVITKGPDEESASLLAKLCPAGVDLVMSSQAWLDFEVPGSPYVVVADGRSGRIKGQGSGTSFSQVGALIEQAANDGRHANGVVKSAADRERAADVDRILLAAGIAPGDESLYRGTGPDAR